MRQSAADQAARGRMSELLSGRRECSRDSRELFANIAFSKDVLNYAIDHLVSNQPRSVLIAQRAAKNAPDGKQCSAPASQAVGGVVITHQFALHAEDCVSQLKESYIGRPKMWHYEVRAPLIPDEVEKPIRRR